MRGPLSGRSAGARSDQYADSAPEPDGRLLLPLAVAIAQPPRYEPSAAVERVRGGAREQFSDLEHSALQAHLQRRQSIALPQANDRRDVPHELAERFVRGAAGCRRLAAQSRAKSALRALQPAPQPVPTRQRQSCSAAACCLQPSSPTCHAAQHRAREKPERHRAHHETSQHRRQLHREGPAAARAPRPI